MELKDDSEEVCLQDSSRSSIWWYVAAESLGNIHQCEREVKVLDQIVLLIYIDIEGLRLDN